MEARGCYNNAFCTVMNMENNMLENVLDTIPLNIVCLMETLDFPKTEP